MAPPDPASLDTDGGDFAPLLLLRRALHYWKFGFVIFLICVAATAGAANWVKQVYRSEAIILYRQSAHQGYGENDELPRHVGTRLEGMLYVHERLGRVIKDLKLFPEARTLPLAVEMMRKQLVFKIREGATFSLSYEGNSPKEVREVVRLLAEGLLEDSTKGRVQDAEQFKRFLVGERQRLAADLKTKENDLSQFLRKHPEMLPAAPADPGPGQSSGQPETFALEMEMSRLREKEQADSALVVPVVPGPTPAARETPEMIEAVRRASDELEQVRKDLAAKKEVLSEAHPDYMLAAAAVKRSESRLTKASEALNAVRAATAAAAGPEAARPAPASRESAERIAIIERRLVDLRRQPRSTYRAPVRRDPNLDVQYQSLSRDLEEARDRLGVVDNKEYQTAAQAKLEANQETRQLIILDPPQLPGGPFRNLKRMTAYVGVGASFFLMMVAALARAYFDDRIYSRADITWLVATPVLAVVPRARRLKST